MEQLFRKLFNRNPEISEFLTPLHVGTSPDINMEQFRAGIDNLHIDVVLSPKFKSALVKLVTRIVQEELSRLGYSDTLKYLEKQDLDTFRHAYRGIWEGVFEQSNRDPLVLEHAKLLQLALLKTLLTSPGQVIAELRRQLYREVDTPSRDNHGRSLELHERLVFIAKHETGIRFRTLRRLFKMVQQLEAKEIRKIRKSILGTSWVLPKNLLFNPLLQLQDLTHETYLVNFYPLVCIDSGDERYFVITNRIFCEQFSGYLADWCQPVKRIKPDMPAGDGYQLWKNEWQGGFAEFLEGHRMLEQALQKQEYDECRCSWLDSPKNIELIFHRPTTTSWFARVSSKHPLGSTAKSKAGWQDFQQRMTHELHKRLYKTGVLRRVIASYRTLRLHRQLNERISIRDIYQYLVGELPRRKLIQHLNLSSSTETDEVVRALDAVYNYIQRMPTTKQLEYTTRYVKDFLSFRRDLKLAHFTHQQMTYLRLLTDSDDINLSRDNGSLYEFRLLSESEPSEQRIRAHVVLKADIRGSTEITQQLMQERLNPATHFSLNFFGPITNLLDRFNAEKVFVEGDALILSVLDTGGASNQSMIVAHACGLACQVLSVMEYQNRQHQNHRLPKLELGLGIAFSNDAPAYLYDDKRKIMISPAINQADRLSSCAAKLRRNTVWKTSSEHCVEVMCTGLNEQQQTLLRYNVNGIELEPAAFARLNQEIVMHKVRLQSPSGSFDHYHAGRFVDRLGASHWIIVREAPIKLFSDDNNIMEPGGRSDKFYEVINHSELIARVKSKLRYRRTVSQPVLDE
jgi:hypothetical protein